MTKTCTPQGWLSLEGREWSNYTNCARDDIYVRRLRYSIGTNMLSVSFIIPALVIFNSYRYAPRVLARAASLPFPSRLPRECYVGDCCSAAVVGTREWLSPRVLLLLRCGLCFPVH